EAHEPGIAYEPERHETVSGSLESGHSVGSTRSDRLHDTTAEPGLADKGLGDFWEGGRHQDGVVRRFCGPTFGAVAVNDLYVLDVLCCEVSTSHLGQVGPSFDP